MRWFETWGRVVFRKRDGNTMQITLKILKAVVMVGNGTDQIQLTLDAPATFKVMDYKPTMKMEASPGAGVQWVRDNFGIEPQVIDLG